MSTPVHTQELLIGFDLGTSAVKAILSDTAGRIVSKSRRNVDLISPKPDWFEIDAEAYRKHIVSILAELAAAAGPDGHVLAVSFCGATGNTILLDESHRPIRNVISWLDQRATEEADILLPGFDDESVRECVGWGWNRGFPLAHLAWLKAHEPDSFNRARWYGMLNDFLYYELCGTLAVDPSKATTCYLQDQKRREWNDEYLAMLGINEASLPVIVESGSRVGNLSGPVVEATGLAPDTQVAAGSFDHPGAARSTGVFDQGDLLISAGTSWVVFAPVEDRSVGVAGGMLIDPFLSPAGCWGVMFSLTAVANRIDAILQALLGKEENLNRRFDELAVRSKPGADGLLINPWEQSVDEVVQSTSKVRLEDAMRALMEGCCYLMRHRIEKLAEIRGGPTRRIVMVGGPTKSPIWPQILADVLGHSLAIPETGPHAGAMGAAILAGVSAGIYTNERDGFARTKSAERIIEPDLAERTGYEARYQAFLRRFGQE